MQPPPSTLTRCDGHLVLPFHSEWRMNAPRNSWMSHSHTICLLCVLFRRARARQKGRAGHAEVWPICVSRADPSDEYSLVGSVFYSPLRGRFCANSVTPSTIYKELVETSPLSTPHVGRTLSALHGGCDNFKGNVLETSTPGGTDGREEWAEMRRMWYCCRPSRARSSGRARLKVVALSISQTRHQRLNINYI